MNNQNTTRTIKKFAGFATGMLLLPLVAACEPDQAAEVPPAQAPTTTVPPTTGVPATPAPVPEVTTTPVPTPQSTATSPPTTGARTDSDIADVVATNPSLSTLRNILDRTDLGDELDNDGPYTFFAPSDQAFAAIPQATRQRLLQPENRETVRQIFANHLVSGNLTANQLQSGQVQTLANTPVNVQVDRENNQVRVNNARVTQPNIQASNGVIHVIDQVIIPPNL